MSPGWQLVIHEQAWDFSERLRSAEKAQLKRGLRSLVNDPNQRPDAFRRSPAGRDYSVKYFGRFRVLYWLDPFVQEVRIVEIDFVRPGYPG
jgi:hypothetical protein